MTDKKQTGSLFSRLTKLFRSGPIVRRKVRDFRQKGASSALEVFKKAHSDVYNSTLSAYGAFDRMSRYSDFAEMEACVSGDTLIAIPNGYITIEELSKTFSKDETFVVYSYDHSKGQIVPALGKQARKTTTAHAIKLTFDTGKTLTCTPDHRVMKRDGTYCQAIDAQIGESMMPFYRKNLFDKNIDENSSGYRWVYSMNKDPKKSTMTNGWVTEHRLIAEWVAGRDLEDNEVVHHINFTKNDNRPENLQIMDSKEHGRYHAEILNGKKWSIDNSEWISSFKKNHSEFMKNNNPATRHDVTFELILNLCDLHGYNLYDLGKRLDCDLRVIYRRISEKGFANFEQFASAYSPGWKNNGQNNLGNKNPRYDHSLTFQHICNAFDNTMKISELSKILNTTEMKIKGRLKIAGYKDWKSFCENYANHKVVSIEDIGIIDLYDLTVDGYKNYATDSIIVHNTPEIASALDIYAEETISSDDKGQVLHIHSENKKIQEILEELFYDILNVDFNLPMWSRNLVKYGDFFIFNDISPEYGIINAYPIPISEIEREEGFDPNDPAAVRFRWITQGNQTLENWQITHFRLLGNDAFLPYGSSVLESARRIWRQLIMMEDAMLVYRVIRAPERRVFYIDVGNTPPENISEYMEQAQTALKRTQVVDRSSGRVDLRYNPLSVDEDYFLAVRGGDTGTKIDTLAGGQNTAAIEDVQYIQKKLFAALKIPKAYLGYDEDVGSKATLAQEDIRFSRAISKIQKTIISSLNQLAQIHLYCHGFEDEDLGDFSLLLTNPSSTAQQQKLDLIKMKFDIAGAAPEGVVDRRWIRKEVLGLTNDDIEMIKQGRIDDKLEDAEVEASAGQDEGSSDGGSSAEPIEGLDDTGSSAEGEPGDLFAGDKKPGDLLIAVSGTENEKDAESDENSDMLEFDLSIDDEDAPEKTEKKLLNVFGGPIKASRKVTHGPAALHQPDFKKMVAVGSRGRNQDSLNKPFDDDFFSLGESLKINSSYIRPKVTRDVKNMISALGKSINRNRKSLIAEDLEAEFNINHNDEA